MSPDRDSAAPVRVAVVGPGRIGSALAALWARAGDVDFVGFLGRDAERTRGALARVGSGRILHTVADLAGADCVLLAVPDGAIAAVVEQVVAQCQPKPDSLWLHASGVHGLDILEPLRQHGVCLGSLHPVCPVTDATAGIRDLPGKPAVLQADPAAQTLLARLATAAGMRPVPLPATDRRVYHAACNLAANGLTALLDLVQHLLEEQCGLDPEHARRLPIDLMRGALDVAARVGSTAAMSGPVRRREAEILGRHVEALAEQAPDGLRVYRALMAWAVAMALRDGNVTPDVAAKMLREVERRRQG